MLLRLLVLGILWLLLLLLTILMQLLLYSGILSTSVSISTSFSGGMVLEHGILLLLLRLGMLLLRLVVLSLRLPAFTATTTAIATASDIKVLAAATVGIAAAGHDSSIAIGVSGVQRGDEDALCQQRGVLDGQRVLQHLLLQHDRGGQLQLFGVHFVVEVCQQLLNVGVVLNLQYMFIKSYN